MHNSYSQNNKVGEVVSIMTAEIKAVTKQIYEPDQLPEELKLQAASLISIPAMMQKRKRPLQAAR